MWKVFLLIPWMDFSSTSTIFAQQGKLYLEMPYITACYIAMLCYLTLLCLFGVLKNRSGCKTIFYFMLSSFLKIRLCSYNLWDANWKPPSANFCQQQRFKLGKVFQDICSPIIKANIFLKVLSHWQVLPKNVMHLMSFLKWNGSWVARLAASQCQFILQKMIHWTFRNTGRRTNINDLPNKEDTLDI